MRSHWQEGGLLACVVVAIYANSLSGSFHYDDFHSLVWNPHIRDLQSIPAFFADPGLFSADPDKAMFRPLLLVSYGVNYALGGYEVAGYHLFNLLVHLVCVLLIWHIAAPLGRIGALVSAAARSPWPSPYCSAVSRSIGAATAWVRSWGR